MPVNTRSSARKLVSPGAERPDPGQSFLSSKNGQKNAGGGRLKNSAITNATGTQKVSLQRKVHRGRKRARRSAEDNPSLESQPVFPKRGSFVKLPTDMIFEILALLNPSELASLAQTNKVLRATLTGSQTSSLWTAARRLAANTPEPPTGVSEITWARYLYAPPICQSDIDATSKKLADLCSDIDLRKVGAKEALRQFEKQQLKHADAARKYVGRMYWWLWDFQRYLNDTRKGLHTWRFQRLRVRFGDLGYEDQDFEQLLTYKDQKLECDMNDPQVWRVVGKPLIRPRIEAARDERLGGEHGDIVNVRKSLIKTAYDEYKRQMKPIEWIHLPSTSALYAMTPFRRLIYSDFDTPLTQATCSKVARRLPSYLSAFRNHVRDHLISCPVDDLHDNTDKARKYLVKDTDGLGYRSLAVDAFALYDDGGKHGMSSIPLFGVDDVFAHLSYPDSKLHHPYRGSRGPEHNGAFWISLGEMTGREGQIADYTLYYDKKASDTVRDLIVKLGLDPRTARAEDLNRLGARLACRYVDCHARSDDAYTWRHAVEHWVSHHDGPSWRDYQPEWQILDEQVTACVRLAEASGRSRYEMPSNAMSLLR
ncbi:hypothetical protein FOMPIDRAFT_89703 [Fomitopsis schrenkii]|uniref:F-box domain-containing protein n=1 Tax=Fomitopsis schrenkii TaxID=2126942 RepID=S8FFN1_FOMSC|nr:hypothetical protein FOMPIDRAFT_89703 [Fomitopsis schrenkii]